MYLPKVVCGICIVSSILVPLLKGTYVSSDVLLLWIISFQINRWVSRTFGSQVENAKFRISVSKFAIDIKTRGVCMVLYNHLYRFVVKNVSDILFFITPGLQSSNSRSLFIFSDGK